MELKRTAQTTRKKTIRMVLMYRLAKGRLAMASEKLSRVNCLGRMVGGICILSGTVLELVRIIQTKGKIIITAPRIRKKYVINLLIA